MKNIKTIFILVLSLILLLAVSCSNEDKTGGGTGINNNPPENDTELLGAYRDDILYSMYGPDDCSKVSYDEITKETKIEGPWRKDGTNPPKGQMKAFLTKKWKQTKKGGKIIKLESELVSEWFGGKFTVTYDYETETLSCTFASDSGEKYLFNGKKIN